MKARIASLFVIALLAGCSRSGQLTESGGVYVVRSVCPQVEIPAGTGDVTLFNPQGSTAASAIDVVATITNVRGTCDESTGTVVSTASFDVFATRRDAGEARQVVLPYFDAAVQGGSNVVAKRVGAVALNFAAGSTRAQSSGQGTISIDRAAVALPEDIRTELTRERKPGDADAAIDPLSDPKIKAAVERATFEHLIGFQLTQDQLRYNATR